MTILCCLFQVVQSQLQHGRESGMGKRFGLRLCDEKLQILDRPTSQYVSFAT